ncbi:MAG TPA: hypothetical protein VMC10_12580 [Stellaceae bacterium]|nr:hypothetical protein [Stellaceae bacterium]
MALRLVHIGGTSLSLEGDFIIGTNQEQAEFGAIIPLRDNRRIWRARERLRDTWKARQIPGV